MEDTINNLEGFSLEEELSTNGDGINIKGGAIIRISENFKIGASLHSLHTLISKKAIQVQLTLILVQIIILKFLHQITLNMNL